MRAKLNLTVQEIEYSLLAERLRCNILRDTKINPCIKEIRFAVYRTSNLAVLAFCQIGQSDVKHLVSALNLEPLEDIVCPVRHKLHSVGE